MKGFTLQDILAIKEEVGEQLFDKLHDILIIGEDLHSHIINALLNPRAWYLDNVILNNREEVEATPPRLSIADHVKCLRMPACRVALNNPRLAESQLQVCLHPGIGLLGRCLSDMIPSDKCSNVPDLDDCFVTGHPVRDFLDWVWILQSFTINI